MNMVRIAIYRKGFTLFINDDSTNVFFQFIAKCFMNKICSALGCKNNLNIHLSVSICHFNEMIFRPI